MARILIVDDNITLTMELEEILSSSGYDVAGTAYTADEAISMAKSLKPDLVLMDIAMPGKLDGIDAAGILREELGIPVIFISIHTNKDFLERAKEVEPLGYLHKPFSCQQIEAAIEMAFSKMDREKELAAAYDKLEQQVKKQSAELQKANALLKIQSVEVAHLEATASKMMEQLGGDKTQLEASMISQLTELFISLLQKLKDGVSDGSQECVVEAVETMLGNLITPFLTKLPNEYHAFTLTELRIAALLKEGRNSKEVAEILCLAPSTIIWYRKRMRRKLGIEDPKEMLVDYLPTI